MNSFSAAIELAERISSDMGVLEDFRDSFTSARATYGVWISLEKALSKVGLLDEFDRAAGH
jgi:hypothetical protein